MLTAIGLGIVTVGVIVVSNVWKAPHYKGDGRRPSRLSVCIDRVRVTMAAFTDGRSASDRGA